MKRKFINYVLVAFLILSALLIAVACSDASKKGECEHEFDEWSAIREPSCTKEGKEVRRCGLCGERESKKIEIKEHIPVSVAGPSRGLGRT